MNTVVANPGFLDQLIVSDEAVFSLNSEINSRNVTEYAEHGNGQPPDHYVEFAQGADQVMVWVGLTRKGVVLGPHFAERNLDSREHSRIIGYHVIQHDFNFEHKVQYQQKCCVVAARWCSLSYKQCDDALPSRIVSRKANEQTWRLALGPWPSRSPDLAICYFFLCSYLR